MPRPRRARPAPATATATQPSSAVNNDDTAQGRGRTRNTRSRLSLEENAAMRAANHSRDAALDRLANEDITTSSAGPDNEDRGSSVEVGRRAMATPAQLRDTTGLDLADDDVFGDLGDSFDDGDVPNVPRSADNSSLTLSNFKTRSRQSSFVGRNDPPIRPSSRGGTTTPGVSSSFNIGVFRRRAREPSILGTSRKPRADDATATAQDSDVESEDDFAPEAESTPLNRRRTRAAVEAADEHAANQAGKPNSRKRKSEDASGGSTRPEKVSRVEAEVQNGESDSELSSLDSPQPPRPALRERPVTPNNLDEIAAPPASSGSEGEDDVWPDIHALAKRRRRPSVTTPVRPDNLSDISSPPSLTHSPNFAEAKSAKSRGGRRASPKLTTADLASLLPKRRYKKNHSSPGGDSDNEVDNSGLAQDEDELSHLDTRAARKRKTSRAARAASQSGPTTSSALQPRQTPASSRYGTRATRAQTRLASDKENQSESEEEEESAFHALPDDTFDAGTENGGEILTASELKQAAKKFKEVDKWSLEFEEVAEPASPQDAR